MSDSSSEKPSFVWIWRGLLVRTALVTCGTVMSVMVVLSIVRGVRDGGISPADVVGGALSLVLWGTWLFCVAGWLVVLVASLAVAGIRYGFARRRFSRAQESST